MKDFFADGKEVAFKKHDHKEKQKVIKDNVIILELYMIAK